MQQAGRGRRVSWVLAPPTAFTHTPASVPRPRRFGGAVRPQPGSRPHPHPSLVSPDTFLQVALNGDRVHPAAPRTPAAIAYAASAMAAGVRGAAAELHRQSGGDAARLLEYA